MNLAPGAHVPDRTRWYWLSLISIALARALLVVMPLFAASSRSLVAASGRKAILANTKTSATCKFPNMLALMHVSLRTQVC